MKPLSVIVATDLVGGFSKAGQIPWHYKEDFQHFKKTTMGHVCVMGRSTYEDILARKLPAPGEEILPGRTSYVLTRNPAVAPIGAKRVAGLMEALSDLDSNDKREVFVIGGELLYREALPFTKKIYMTVVNKICECDKFIDTDYINKYFDIVRVTDNTGKEVTAQSKSKDEILFFEFDRVKQ